jgi:hypothetical protein
MVERSTYLKVQLKFPCPGNECPRDRYLDWCHAKCGSAIWFDTKGDLWCISHPGTKSFIKKWGFKCNHNKHIGDRYEHFTKGHLLIAIGNCINALENENPELV